MTGAVKRKAPTMSIKTSTLTNEFIAGHVLGKSDEMHYIEVSAVMAKRVRTGIPSAMMTIARRFAKMAGLKGTARGVRNRQILFTKRDRRFGGEHICGAIVVIG